jgi:hypothetical protein
MGPKINVQQCLCKIMNFSSKSTNKKKKTNKKHLTFTESFHSFKIVHHILCSWNLDMMVMAIGNIYLVYLFDAKQATTKEFILIPLNRFMIDNCTY